MSGSTVIGSIYQVDGVRCFIRTTTEDIAIDDIEILPELEPEVLAKKRHFGWNPFTTVVDLLGRYVFEIELEEYSYSETDLLIYKKEARIHKRATVKKVLASASSCEWNLNIVALREFSKNENYALVNKSVIRFGPSWILNSSVCFQNPVSPMEAYLFWALEEKRWIRILELYLTNGLYFAGNRGDLKIYEVKPKMEVTIDGVNVSNPDTLFHNKNGDEDSN